MDLQLFGENLLKLLAPDELFNITDSEIGLADYKVET